MSRFPELFERGDRRGRDRRGAPRRGARGAHRAADRRRGRRRVRAEVRIVGALPDAARRRRSPACQTQEMVSLIGDRGGLARAACGASSASRRPASTPARARRASSAAAPPSGSPRPASATLDVERILELVPLATHNQRGRGHALRRHAQTRERRGSRRDRRELDERPDLRAAEAARRAVRRRARAPAAALRRGLGARSRSRRRSTRYPALDDGDFLLSRQVNFETIHDHDVVAERHGTVGELRGGADARRARRRTTPAREWLSRRPDEARARRVVARPSARPAARRPPWQAPVQPREAASPSRGSSDQRDAASTGRERVRAHAAVHAIAAGR